MRNAVVELFRFGVTVADIAATLNCGEGFVRYHIDKERERKPGSLLSHRAYRSKRLVAPRTKSSTNHARLEGDLKDYFNDAGLAAAVADEFTGDVLELIQGHIRLTAEQARGATA